MGYISWYLCFVAYINCFSLYHQFILTAHHVPLGFNIHENDGHFITRAIASHPFSSLFHLSHTNSRAPSAEVPLDYISIALQSLRAVDARFFNAHGCSCRHVQHQWPDVETRQSVHGFPSSPFLGVACFWVWPAPWFCIVVASLRLHTMQPPFLDRLGWHCYCCIEPPSKPPPFLQHILRELTPKWSLHQIPQCPTPLLLPIDLSVVFIRSTKCLPLMPYLHALTQSLWYVLEITSCTHFMYGDDTYISM